MAQWSNQQLKRAIKRTFKSVNNRPIKIADLLIDCNYTETELYRLENHGLITLAGNTAYINSNLNK